MSTLFIFKSNINKNKEIEVQMPNNNLKGNCTASLLALIADKLTLACKQFNLPNKKKEK